ncbi:hypothetical protein G7054_g10235 [Neopestalotiopsis clavispora]|nr:hypothetical protein G7054_g10235 [Neopestalotiopsis clavispora]
MPLFKEVESDLDFATIQDLGFPADSFSDEDSVSTGFFADPSVPRDVFVGQTNFIPGGCILVSAVHHAASDQGAFFQMTKLWGSHYAAIQSPMARPLVIPQESDRWSVLHEIWTKENTALSTKEIPLDTWGLVGLVSTDFQPRDIPRPLTPSPKSAERPLKTCVFYIPPDNLASLRQLAIQEAAVLDSISANNAVCALIWRSAMQVRVAARRLACPVGEDAMAESSLNMVYDGRSNYSTALPQPYLGNLTFNVMSKLPLDTLTGPSGSVGQVAAVINSNAGRVSSADLLNLYNLLSHTSSYDELIRMKRLRTSTIDGNDMSISSLMNIPVDSLCFGDGKKFGNKGFVEAARLLMGTVNKWTWTCVVLPKLKNGGVEFLVNLRDEEFTLLIENQHFIQFALHL